MINKKEILAIIPARGGSKGLPGKNIKLLNEKPLIAHTILEAKNSRYINRIIVSTDDNAIAEIANQWGAEVPFMRCANLATDESKSNDVILDVLKWLKENDNYIPDYIMLLQCTSPLRESKHIDEAIDLLFENSADAIVSVKECEENPYWMKILVDNKIKSFINSNNAILRRQELPNIYSLNGAIYMTKTQFFLEHKDWYGDNTIAYIMDKESSIDVDDILDFKLAELILNLRGGENE